MVLRMARATKRPESSKIQYRKRVPRDVLAIVGGPREVKVSLRTSDRTEANRLHSEMDARFEAQCAQIRLGIQALDDKQVSALAGEIYRDVIGRMKNQRDLWAQHAWVGFKAGMEILDKEEFSTHPSEWIDKLDRMHGPNINSVLNARGMSLTGETYSRLVEPVHREMKLAADVFLRQAGGDWSADTNLARYPDMKIVEPPNPAYQFAAVWADWVALAKPSANTVRRWKPALEKMLKHVGTTDMSAITDIALEAWKADLVKSDLSNNTIAKVHLAAVKRLFAFAKRERAENKLASNPAIDIIVPSGTKFALKMRGFEPHEAEIVLKATLVPKSERESPEMAAARHWVPWLCAYKGARVNELTQLRFCDVTKVKGVTVLETTKDAGTVKTDNRKVPIHQDLIDQGFLDFVATKTGEQPLFYKPRKGKKTAIPPYEEMGKRLGKWVRRLDLKDPSLDPNHGWRHAFKTTSGDADIQERVVNAIQGHAPTTQGRRYGKVSTKQMSAAMALVPKFEIDASG